MRWVSKPPFGTPVDPAHPLAAALLAAWSVNEGQGRRMVNAASPGTYDLVQATAGSAAWSSGSRGWGYQFASSVGNAFDAGTIAGIDGSSGLTVALCGNADPTHPISLMRDSGSGFRCGTTVSGGNAYLMINDISMRVFGAVPAGDIAFVAVFDGSIPAIKLWANSKPLSLTVQGTIPTSIPSRPSDTWHFGRHVNFADAGRIDFGAVWSRAFNEAEALALTASPWDIYRPSPSWSEAEIAAYYGASATTFRRTISPRFGSRSVA